MDYIRINRMGGAAGVTESCGTSAGSNVEQLDSGGSESVNCIVRKHKVTYNESY